MSKFCLSISIILLAMLPIISGQGQEVFINSNVYEGKLTCGENTISIIVELDKMSNSWIRGNLWMNPKSKKGNLEGLCMDFYAYKLTNKNSRYYAENRFWFKKNSSNIITGRRLEDSKKPGIRSTSRLPPGFPLDEGAIDFKPGGIIKILLPNDFCMAATLWENPDKREIWLNSIDQRNREIFDSPYFLEAKTEKEMVYSLLTWKPDWPEKYHDRKSNSLWMFKETTFELFEDEYFIPVFGKSYYSMTKEEKEILLQKVYDLIGIGKHSYMDLLSWQLDVIKKQILDYEKYAWIYKEQLVKFNKLVKDYPFDKMNYSLEKISSDAVFLDSKQKSWLIPEEDKIEVRKKVNSAREIAEAIEREKARKIAALKAKERAEKTKPLIEEQIQPHHSIAHEYIVPSWEFRVFTFKKGSGCEQAKLQMSNDRAFNNIIEQSKTTRIHPEVFQFIPSGEERSVFIRIFNNGNNACDYSLYFHRVEWKNKLWDVAITKAIENLFTKDEMTSNQENSASRGISWVYSYFQTNSVKEANKSLLLNEFNNTIKEVLGYGEGVDFMISYLTLVYTDVLKYY